MTEWRLRIGNRLTGISVKRDDKYPPIMVGGKPVYMWRVHGPNQISDIVNLARAKDAAITWARPRGLGGHEVIAWDRRETS